MWLLPSSACARAAVNQEMAQGVKTGHLAVKVDEDGRFSPPCRPLCSRLRKGAWRPAPLPLNWNCHSALERILVLRHSPASGVS